MKLRMGAAIAVLLAMVLALSVPAFAEEVQKVEIPVEIVLNGSVFDAKDDFTVQITAVTEDAPMPAESTVKITGAGSASFQMEYPELGVFSYTVKQVAGSADYIEYDEAEYKLTVYVVRAEDGTVGVQINLEDAEGNKVEKASFTNTYLPLAPAELDPPIKKIVIVKHGTIPEGTTFTYAMIPSEPTAPMPEPGAATKDEETGALYLEKDCPDPSVGSEEYEFGWMTFDETHVGKTYTYTLKEMPGTDPNFEYATNEYTMTVKVGFDEEARKVVLDVTYTEGDKAVDIATFTNVYDEPEPETETETETESESEPETEPEVPDTGDNSHFVRNVILMSVSGVGVIAAIVLLVVFLRKPKKQEESNGDDSNS